MTRPPMWLLFVGLTIASISTATAQDPPDAPPPPPPRREAVSRAAAPPRSEGRVERAPERRSGEGARMPNRWNDDRGDRGGDRDRGGYSSFGRAVPRSEPARRESTPAPGTSPAPSFNAYNEEQRRGGRRAPSGGEQQGTAGEAGGRPRGDTSSGRVAVRRSQPEPRSEPAPRREPTPAPRGWSTSPPFTAGVVEQQRGGRRGAAGGVTQGTAESGESRPRGDHPPTGVAVPRSEPTRLGSVPPPSASPTTTLSDTTTSNNTDEQRRGGRRAPSGGVTQGTAETRGGRPRGDNPSTGVAVPRSEPAPRLGSVPTPTTTFNETEDEQGRGGRRAPSGPTRGTAVPRGSRARGDNPTTGVAVPRSDPRWDGRRGGRDLYRVPRNYYNYSYYYYPRRYYPYGYGAFGLGYFYYDPYRWWPYYHDYRYPAYYYGGYYGGSGYYGRSGYGYAFGQLRLNVTPRHAEVYIDGYFSGYVDDFDGLFQSLTLEEGSYHMEIVAPGYETLEFDIRILPGRKITYRGDLRPRP